MGLIARLKNALCVMGGLALVVYGLVCLMSVDHWVIGKFALGARDSWGVPVLLILLGGTSVLHGWIDHSNRRT